MAVASLRSRAFSTAPRLRTLLRSVAVAVERKAAEFARLDSILTAENHDAQYRIAAALELLSDFRRAFEEARAAATATEVPGFRERGSGEGGFQASLLARREAWGATDRAVFAAMDRMAPRLRSLQQVLVWTTATRRAVATKVLLLRWATSAMV